MIYPLLSDEAKILQSGDKTTHSTLYSCPLQKVIIYSVQKSHTIIVLSSPPDTINLFNRAIQAVFT